MSSTNDDGGKRLPIRMIFESAAAGIAVTAMVATIVTGAMLPAMIMGTSLSAAYLLKKRH